MFVQILPLSFVDGLDRSTYHHPARVWQFCSCHGLKSSYPSWSLQVCQSHSPSWPSHALAGQVLATGQCWWNTPAVRPSIGHTHCPGDSDSRVSTLLTKSLPSSSKHRRRWMQTGLLCCPRGSAPGSGMGPYGTCTRVCAGSARRVKLSGCRVLQVPHLPPRGPVPAGYLQGSSKGPSQQPRSPPSP